MVNRALMIGFGQFDEGNDFRQLKSVQHNMEILSDILTKSDGGSGLFQKRNIRQLIDQPATVAQQSVDSFLNKANSEDKLSVRCSAGTPPRLQRAFCRFSARAVKLSPPSTTPTASHRE